MRSNSTDSTQARGIHRRPYAAVQRGGEAAQRDKRLGGGGGRVDPSESRVAFAWIRMSCLVPQLMFEARGARAQDAQGVVGRVEDEPGGQDEMRFHPELRQEESRW